MSGIRDRSVIRSPVTPSAKYCCSESLLKLLKGSTTIDSRGAADGSAAAADASASEGSPSSLTSPIKRTTPARHRTNDPLLGTTVVDRPARRVEPRRQGRIRHDPAAPNAVDQIILGDDLATVAHQIDEEIEHLWFECHWLRPAAQLTPLDVEHVIVKPENHPRFPGSVQADDVS